MSPWSWRALEPGVRYPRAAAGNARGNLVTSAIESSSGLDHRINRRADG